MLSVHLKPLLIALITLSSIASAEPKYILNSSQGKTSDDLNLSQFWFGYISDSPSNDGPFPSQHLTSKNWSLLGRQITVDRPNYAYSGTELILGATQPFRKEWTLYFGAGAHLLNFETKSKSSTHLIGEINVRYSEFKAIWASFRLAQQFNYPTILPLTGDPISAKGLVAEPELLWRPLARLRLKVSAQEAWLEDHNRRLWLDTEMMWQLHSQPNWIWIGFGTERLQNSLANTNYWSPNWFYSYGPRFDSRWVLNESWQLFLGGRLNRMKESHYDSSEGYQMRTGINFGDQEKALFQISYQVNSSTQGGRTWKNDSFGFGINTNW